MSADSPLVHALCGQAGSLGYARCQRRWGHAGPCAHDVDDAVLAATNLADELADAQAESDALRERLAGRRARRTRAAVGFLSLGATLAVASLGVPLLFVAACAAAGCGAMALVDDK